MATTEGNNESEVLGSRPDKPVNWIDSIDKETFEKCVMRNPNVFLVIKSEGYLSKVNPFVIDDSVRSLAGDGNLRSVKRLRSGELLVETDSCKQAQRLLTAKELAKLPIETTIHKTLNTCKGVITSGDLSGCTEDEILKGLKKESVIFVKRIMARRE